MNYFCFHGKKSVSIFYTNEFPNSENVFLYIILDHLIGMPSVKLIKVKFIFQLCESAMRDLLKGKENMDPLTLISIGFYIPIHWSINKL